MWPLRPWRFESSLGHTRKRPSAPSNGDLRDVFSFRSSSAGGAQIARGTIDGSLIHKSYRFEPSRFSVRLLSPDLLQQSLDLIVRLWEISLHHHPHSGGVDAMVSMRNSIPEPTHLLPGNRRVLRFHLVREIRRRLADDFQRPSDGVAKQAILPVILQVPTGCEIAGIGHRLVNIGEILRLTACHDPTRR